MASAMVALATTTLGSTAATVTFGSIPATYRDLRLVMQVGATSTVDNMRIQVNADTGANYNWVVMRGNGSTGTSSSASSQTYSILDLLPSGVDTSFSNQYSVDFLDASATDKHKTWLTRSDNASQSTQAIASRWASTSAITSIKVYIPGTTFAANSVFSLYGIVSA